jgi:hypothetical protein
VCSVHMRAVVCGRQMCCWWGGGGGGRENQSEGEQKLSVNLLHLHFTYKIYLLKTN